jgi:uncharacterized protein DUF6174
MGRIGAGSAGLLLAGLLAVGCQSPTGDSGEPDSEIARLERNAALWHSQGVTSYRFEYRHVCFCPPPYTDPVTIVVRNGAIASVTYLGNGQPVPDAILPHYLTVDQLFALGRQALKQAASTTLAYDPRMGYPTRLEVDWRREIADDEGFHQASNVQAIR